MKDIIIKEVKDRKLLREGRRTGMAFAFLKKISNNKFETVNPISPCKDYLAEVVYTENTGIPTKAHGLNYSKKLNIFNNRFGYLVMNIVSDMNGKYHMNTTKDADIKLLNKNYKNIEKHINELENLIGIKTLTKIEKANDDYFLIKVPLRWCRSTIAISLYTLLIRVYMYSNGTQDSLTFLKNMNGMDKGFINDAIPKLELIIKKKKLPPFQRAYRQDLLLKGLEKPHNDGILSWNIYENPFKKVNPIM